MLPLVIPSSRAESSLPTVYLPETSLRGTSACLEIHPSLDLMQPLSGPTKWEKAEHAVGNRRDVISEMSVRE